MSSSRFTERDARALLALLGTLAAMTIALWLPLHFLTSLTLSVSDVYVLCCVLLLIIHSIRRRIRARRATESKEPSPS